VTYESKYLSKGAYRILLTKLLVLKLSECTEDTTQIKKLHVSLKLVVSVTKKLQHIYLQKQKNCIAYLILLLYMLPINTEILTFASNCVYKKNLLSYVNIASEGN
jgi:hypothetical protein